MGVDFKDSITKDNLIRAFAGESQAYMRYNFAAKQACQEKLHVIEAVFKFTAEQEKAHAKIFYDHLTELAGENLLVDGRYPVDINKDIGALLKKASENEYEEHDDIYKTFGDKANEEGFLKVHHSFREIARIEKVHGDRFLHLAELVSNHQLFVSDVETGFMCLHCGYIYTGTQAPKICPVCQYDQGYFIRLELAPYTVCHS